MTAAQIIQEIDKLSSAELAEVVRHAKAVDASRQLSGEELGVLAKQMVAATDPTEIDRLKQEIIKDFISAWDSIWHVPLPLQHQTFVKLGRMLNPGGVLIFTSGGLDAPGEVTNRFLGLPLYHATPGIPELLSTIHESGCICRHLEYDQFPEKHLYFIVQKSASPKATRA